MIQCIYCNSKDMTVSDIIPFALTGAKVKKSFVCKIHNAYTNDSFEKKTIAEFDYFRSSLGLTTREGNPIKYTANIKIDDVDIKNALISNRASIYDADKRLFKGTQDGQKVLLGAIEQLKKIKGANPQPIDLKNLTVEYSFSLNKLFTSATMLHTIAKIAYEWHCYINNINNYDENIYSNIVNYILGNIEDKNIVEIVVDGGIILNVMERLCDLGTNSLYEYIDQDGYLYVIYNFWNVAAYKVRIRNTGISNQEQSNLLDLHMYNLDGTKTKTSFGVYGSAHVISEEPTVALLRMKKYYIDKLEALMKTKILSIYLVRQLISEADSYIQQYSKGEIDFPKLLDYESNDRITALQLIICFSEHENDYDKEVSFNDNIRSFLNVEEILHVSPEQKMDFLMCLKELNDSGKLIDLLEHGISVFNAIWEKESKRLDSK